MTNEQAMVSTERAPNDSGEHVASNDAQPLGPPTPTPLGEPEVGHVIGRYVILGRLGRGGMGTVLKAYDEALDRAIALKLLHPGVAELHAERLTREAQALARLSHPNVVHVYEVGEADGRWFIAMELVHGETVRRWQRARPAWTDCVQVYLQAGEGLAAAHARGLVHRDFKPDNCIVDEHGRVRVLDFGLVREVGPSPAPRPPQSSDETTDDPHEDPLPSITDRASGGGLSGSSSLTRTGAVVGTAAYMPLEQFEGRPVDARGDQFSFCVALYEAVYGERPFSGKTAAALMVAQRHGEVRAAPRGSRVPARLRRALLRGLSRAPEDRWPSMAPLLSELRQLVVPPRRMWPAVLVGGGLLAIAGGVWATTRDEPPCRGATEQLSTVWNADRRAEVRSSILATELPHAAETWERVERRLDDYATEWVERHQEVCEATHVRHEQSAEVMDLRMGCLSTRRLELREAVHVLANANATIVDRAVGMVADLRGPSRCDDVEALRAQLPPPDDRTVAAEVEALRERLLRARSLREAGEYEEGLAEVREVLPRIEPLGYAPLLAEAWLERGQLREGAGRYAEAEDDLQRAYLLAAEHRHRAVEAEAVSLLTAVVGARQARHERGLQWGMTALALARGRRNEPRGEARTLMNIGAVLHHQGELGRAQERFREGLAIEEEVLGPDHPALARMLNNLGAVLFDQGEHEHSLEHHRRALAIWKESLGARHPYVGSSLNNIGEVLHQQGRLEAALSHFREAEALWVDSLGPEHPYVAAALTNLGQVSTSAGRPEEALAYHRRALDIRRTTLGEGHPSVAESLAHVAAAQRELGRDVEARDVVEDRPSE